MVRTRRRCQRHLSCTLKGIRLFLFFGPKFFFDISNPGYGTDATEVSTAPTRCPRRYATIFIFRSKIFFSISRILDMARARRRCQRHLRGALKGMRPFSLFCPKFFLYNSNPGCGTGATEVSTTPTRYLERYATIFIFWSKIFFSISGIRIWQGATKVSTAPTRYPERYATFTFFGSKIIFFDISNPGCATDATEVSTAPKLYPERYSTIFIFRSKIFFRYLESWIWHGRDGGVNGTYAVSYRYATIFIFRSKIFFPYLESWMGHGSDGSVNDTYAVP